MASKRKRPTFSDQIKAAIRSSDVSQYRIARETGIAESALSRFMTGKRGLTTDSLDRLAAFLGLEVVRRPGEQS